MENKKTTPLTQKISFEDLTPNTDVDISNYKAALDHAFLDSDLRNIAITGPYGAGKSSILQTYLKQDGSLKNKFIRISLSHLQPTRNGTPIADSKLKKDAPETNANDPHEDTHDVTQIEQILEGKILNQMIHKLPTNIVNNAGFHSIRLNQEVPSKVFNIGSTILVALFLVCFFVPFLYVHFAPASIKSDFSMISYEAFIILFLIFIALSAVLVAITYKHPKFLRNTMQHIHHVKVQGNEIELFQDSDSPYFDKYLDSILYMLSNSGKQYFIFEDIDRFDTTLIFERLKEINELVNEQESHKGKPVVKFIYLLRDDIFINKERAKFFDFLIPVIPVTNTSNSSDQLNKILISNGLGNIVSPDLIRGLGFYIEDLRLIKNIANEFMIYYSSLVSLNSLNPNKLMAMITYKNLFPKDFSELQKGHGFVHYLLSKGGKSDLISERRSDLIQRKEACESKLTTLNNEQLKSINELAWALLGTNWLPRPYNDNPYANKDTTLADLEEYINSGSFGSQDLRSKIKKEYEQRKKNIIAINNSEIINLKNELIKLNGELNDLNSAPFLKLASVSTKFKQDLFQRDEKDNNNNLISYDPIRNNEYFNLLKYLLINGYIDESYENYTSYFYGEFLTNNDHQFIMNIHNNGYPLWTLNLTHYDVIVKNISLNEFKRPCVLNYGLIHYLLLQAANTDSIASRVPDTLSRLFSNFQGDYISYADQYINKADNYIYFGLLLLKIVPQSLSIIHIDNPMHLEKLIYAVLINLNKEELENINAINDQALTDYIKWNPNFLKQAKAPNDQIVATLIDKFKMLKVSFDTINPAGVSDNLLQAVFENSLYDLNGHNLLVLLVNIAKNYKNVAITEPLTCLKKLNDTPHLSKYWKENMPAFILSAVKNINTTESSSSGFTDNPDILKEFMNDDSIEMNYREDYLSKVATQQIPDFENIHPKMWQILMDNDLMLHSEDNLYTYITNIGMDEHLINSINKFYGDCLDIHKSDNSDRHQFVVNKISAQDKIDTAVYKSFLKATKAKVADVAPLSELKSEDKIAILVRNHFLAMNKELFNFIAKYYPNQSIPYIKSSYETFKEILKNENISIPSDIVDTLIEDPAVNDQDKIDFLNSSDGTLPLLSHMDLSDQVKCHIIDNNLDENEIPDIIKNYDKFTADIKNEIIKLYPEYQEEFTALEALKNWNLMYDICQSEDINDGYKVKIISKLIASIASINKGQIMELLNGMKNTGYSQILKKGEPKFIPITINNDNSALLQGLKDKGYLKEYSAYSNGYKVERNNKTV